MGMIKAFRIPYKLFYEQGQDNDKKKDKDKATYQHDSALNPPDLIPKSTTGSIVNKGTKRA